LSIVKLNFFIVFSIRSIDLGIDNPRQIVTLLLKQK